MPKTTKTVDWSKMAGQIKEAEKASKKFTKAVDARMFTPKLKADGTYEAVIRFIPGKNQEAIPFTKTYSHGFKEIGGWLIESCPTTIGGDCPVCKANSEAWNNGDQDTARQRARKLSIYTNILVIKDPQNKENEGKVFLYRYGKKIHEKIMSAIDPGDDSIDDPVMIFSPTEGANFRLKVKTTHTSGKKYPNYDASMFDSASSLNAEQLKIIENNAYPLEEFTEKSNFKSFDELLERFNKVTGKSGIVNDVAKNTTSDPDPVADVTKSKTDIGQDSEDEESTDSFIKKLKEQQEA